MRQMILVAIIASALAACSATSFLDDDLYGGYGLGGLGVWGLGASRFGLGLGAHGGLGVVGGPGALGGLGVIVGVRDPGLIGGGLNYPWWLRSRLHGYPGHLIRPFPGLISPFSGFNNEGSGARGSNGPQGTSGVPRQ